jgi:hypothetical protein
MLANQRNELTWPMLFDRVPAFGFNHADKLLRFACFSNWNYQAATGLQLGD